MGDYSITLISIAEVRVGKQPLFVLEMNSIMRNYYAKSPKDLKSRFTGNFKMLIT